ncbi:pyruvate kinase [Proteiniclasticum sp. BAD-10]|uniref:Pyruvate kinase n=1 Tax=Proteiniclasticum sediminis TaxID=2804028 RepID=A0A941CTW4_9CLOT|nr:pyruvate kinase [Proteiniclasticum sediminis]MBR0577326.1 pyruvate kinase [Proteiniclasticum sediminis]
MRKTKIICTIGPTSESEETIRELIKAGMNVSRHNFSHGDHATHRMKIERVRAAADELGKTVAILLDTKGPEIRTHDFKDAPVALTEGEYVDIHTQEEVLGDAKHFSLTYDKLAEDVTIGSKILVDDGLIALEVDKINPDTKVITCKILNSGTISNHKGINLPGIKTQLPALTEKDLEDLKFGVEMGVDIIAASFIRKAEDVLAIRRVLRNLGGEDIFLMSKIENQEGVDNVEEIVKYSDGIMVARGDMGVEIPLEQVPIIQKKIIEMCNNVGKPVVTATQMLESMVRFPRPTRAEVSDVANAIFDGSDCIMLSGETANGKYPVDAVKTMVKIACEAEARMKYEKIVSKMLLTHASSVPTAISMASVTTAYELGASAIITATVSGSTAKNVSRFRPECPILAITPNKDVSRKLSLYWGVYPIVADLYESTDEMIDSTADIAKKHGFVHDGELVVITAGLPINFVGSTNMIKVHLIGDVLLQGKRTHITSQVVSGVVRKVTSSKMAEDHGQRGEILVVNSLSDDYMDIIHRFSGVIVETNQVTPGISVEAMKHDIPVIAEAINAMAVLTEGTLVTIDGKRSLVINGRTVLRS